MVSTPSKRAASESPGDTRPAKRPATSSPEEGELDDATPPLSNSEVPKSPPSSKPPPPKKGVAFPFKKKTEKNGVLSPAAVAEPKDKAISVVYERSEEDERRIREADMQRRKAPEKRRGDPSRRAGLSSSTLDHWEPSMDIDRNRDRGSRRGWDADSYPYGRHHYGARDHDYYHREQSHLAHSAPLSHIRSDRDRERDHGRSRSSPSPLSPTNSRSPSTPTSSQRGKHRLPAHRTPEFNFSPPRRDYGVDRIRDRQRESDTAWERDRRDNAQYNDRSHLADEDRHYSSRDWLSDSHAHYHREPIDDQDRYYRPDYDSRPVREDIHRGGDRWLPHLDEYDERRDSRRDDSHREDDWSYHPDDKDRGRDAHLPVSPTTSPRSRRPPSPSCDSAGPSVPPPPLSPPPPPPSDKPKDTTLPAEHAAVTISMPVKRPAAPRGAHSPEPMQLPVAQVNGDGHFSRKEEGQIEGTDDGMKGKASSVAQRQRREPVQRSRAEEEKAYGRTFEGCGQQSDYEVTTKLGEGTFGFVLIIFLLFSGHAFDLFLREVHKAVQKSSGKIMALKRILMHNEKEGMPVTALREIKILKFLKHPCIVEIVDMFVVRSE
jgi:hypothetical protein